VADEWRNWLLEKDAKFVTIKTNPALGTQTLQRGWPKKWVDGQMAAVKTGADTYISGGDGTTPLAVASTITNPVADKGSGAQEVFSGTWALGNNALFPEEFAGLLQTLQLVAAIASLANLAARPYIVKTGDEILELFNIQTGTEDFLAITFAALNPASRATCEALTDAGLTSTFAPDGYSYAHRRWTDQEDGTAQFSILFRKVVWNAWEGNDKDSYDLIEYTEKDQYNEQRTKRWLSIQAADRNAALADLTDDANADTNFHVTDVSPQNRGNGAVDLVQVSIKSTPWSEHDKDSFHTLSYRNQGRDGEVRIKTWFQVKGVDQTTAVSYLNSNADTGFHVLGVEVANNRNTTITLTQRSISQITEVANTDNNLEGQDIIRAHALVSGTLDRKQSVYRHYSSTELAAISDAEPLDYTLVKTSPDIEEDSGLFSKIFFYEKVTWTAWSGNTYTSYDNIVYRNQGRDNEGRLKTWHGIAKDDLTEAVDYLKDDTNCDADFHVLEAKATDNGDGSLTLTQTSIKKVEEKADSDNNLAGTETLRPHDLQTGTMLRKQSVYEHFDATELAAISDTLPAGYTLVKTSPAIEDRGLFSKIFYYEQVAWKSWGHDSYAADITQYGNAGDDNEREVIRKTWVAIQNDDMDTAVLECRTGVGATAESGYVITGVNVDNGGNGSFSITQTQKKQVNAVDVVGTKLINPHALQEGVLAQTVTKYEGFTEANLPDPANKVPGTDADVISNEVQGPHGDGLFSRVIVEETVTWVDWSTNPEADETDYDNAGTDNEREVIRKTWHGIQKGDLSTAIAAARTGAVPATVEAGYRIISAGVKDNGNGSVTITQAQKRQVDNKDLDGEKYLNAHGLASGKVETISTLYEGFTAAGLASAVSGETTPSGYELVDFKDALAGDGSWGRLYLYEKVTWSKRWATDKVLVQESASGGFNAEQIHRAPGVSKTNSATDYGNITADAGYVLEMIQRLEKAHGEFELVRRQKYAGTGTTDDDAVIITLKASVANSTRKELLRVWWRRSATAKDTLIGVGGTAISNYVYDGTSYTHAKVTIRDHGDNAFSVFQHLVDFTDTLNVYWTKTWPEIRVHTQTKNNEKQILTYTKHVSREWTEQNAWDYIEGLQSGKTYVIEGSSRVIEEAPLLFRATCVTIDTSSGIGDWGP